MVVVWCLLLFQILELYLAYFLRVFYPISYCNVTYFFQIIKLFSGSRSLLLGPLSLVRSLSLQALHFLACQLQKTHKYIRLD